LIDVGPYGMRGDTEYRRSRNTIRRNFDIIDLNGDGFIQREELRAHMEKQGI
jgi:Ca2+-binding EF-hand superfamily protein